MATQPARGMRDFLPEDVRRREYVVGVIRDVYDRYGFEPLETPAAENIETLFGRYGEEGNKLIFKILKRGEHEASGQADLALRYDLTVPLARVVAEHQAKLPKFFKRYQIQPVWRAERPARGRYREFYQCDIDAIGSTSIVVEVEIISAACEVLNNLGFENFCIKLNHRELLPERLNKAEIPAELHTHAMVSLDKLDKSAGADVAAEMERRGLTEESVTRLLRGLYEAMEPSPDQSPTTREAILEGLRRALDPTRTTSPIVRDVALRGLKTAFDKTKARDDIERIVELCQGTPAAGHVQFDATLVRGLSYYTGAIMEICVPDLAGSLGGGGRYDNLIGTFLGRNVPACGFSLGLERILVVMEERKMFPKSIVDRNADVMVAIWNDASEADALRLAASIRSEGLRVDVYPEPDKLGKQFKHASSRQIPFVTVVGDDERATGTVTVKDLRNGQQQLVARAYVAEHIKRQLKPDRHPYPRVEDEL